MLLAIDIGNSNISLGLFRGKQLVMRSKFSALAERSADEYAAVLYDMLRINHMDSETITGCMISSVVPSLTELIRTAVGKLSAVQPVLVGPGIRTGFRISIDDPSQLGGDLVANTIAALTEYGAPLILIDAGTVTTISVVDDRKNYLGGCIFPGIRASAGLLKAKTALLPSISLADSGDGCMGKNTADAMRCGLFLGNGMVIDGFISKYMALPHMEGASCIATGGSADLVTTACSNPITIDEDLTLKGLRYLYESYTDKR